VLNKFSGGGRGRTHAATSVAAQ